MNLRHIDPGSAEWMDAMMEGDVDGTRKKPVGTTLEPDDAPALLAGGKATAPETLGSPPQQTIR
jgi:hypothetical protein